MLERRIPILASDQAGLVELAVRLEPPDVVQADEAVVGSRKELVKGAVQFAKPFLGFEPAANSDSNPGFLVHGGLVRRATASRQGGYGRCDAGHPAIRKCRTAR